MREYTWQKEENKWRIGQVFSQCRWFPKYIFKYIREIGGNEDFEQEMEIAIWIADENNYDELQTAKIAQKTIRNFIKSLGFRKTKSHLTGHNQYTLGEFTNSKLCVSEFYELTNNNALYDLIQDRLATRILPKRR